MGPCYTPEWKGLMQKHTYEHPAFYNKDFDLQWTKSIQLISEYIARCQLKMLL